MMIKQFFAFAIKILKPSCNFTAMKCIRNEMSLRIAFAFVFAIAQPRIVKPL